MKTLREKLKKTEEKLSQSQNEISKLSIRAAANFSELTPRPNLDQIFTLFSEHKTEFKELSTIEKTLLINEKLKLVLSSKAKFGKKESATLSPSKKTFSKQRQTIFSNNNSFLSFPDKKNSNMSQSKKSIKVEGSEEESSPKIELWNNIEPDSQIKKNTTFEFLDLLPSPAKK